MNDVYQVISVAVLVFLVVLVVKHSSKSKSSTPAKPYVPPVTLDSAEIQKLGNEAARWFKFWANDPSLDHKWLVIEIGRGEMDCRSIYARSGYETPPHRTIEYSKTIDWDSCKDIAQKVLAIISAQAPNLVQLYGLYFDGYHSLLLPTNGE